MTFRTKRWARGILEALIHGGSSAVVSTFTVTVIDSNDWSPMEHPKKFFILLGATFSTSGMLRAFQYLSNNPLPDEGTSPPFPTGERAIISLNPLAKVTTYEKVKT